MKSINSYYDWQLNRSDILAGKHRGFVGGNWDEIGKLQFAFLVDRGLQPSHRLADVGCGALRGGIHFIRYLDRGNYYGADLNESLIEAGRHELKAAGLADRDAQLLVTDKFELTKFDAKFDYAFAVSVFTHLTMNHIIRCLAEVSRVLAPQGVFYATFFEVPKSAHLENVVHQPGGMETHFDTDPYHYCFEDLAWMAKSAGLKAERIGAWGHPMGQHMAAFTFA